MYLYKQEDRYDTKTGKKVGSDQVFAGVICDFTGEFLGKYVGEHGQSVLYNVDYSDTDPNFGDGEGEFEFCKKYNIDAFTIFGDPFVFKADWESGAVEVTVDLIKAAKKEKYDWPALDSLFRWSRIRMLDKLLKSKKYTLEELGLQNIEERGD